MDGIDFVEKDLKKFRSKITKLFKIGTFLFFRKFLQSVNEESYNIVDIIIYIYIIRNKRNQITFFNDNATKLFKF